MPIFAGYASAQVHLGVYGGLNSANLSGDKPSDWNYLSNSGVMAGVAGEINLTQDVRISFQPGFLHKGTKVGVDVPGERDPKDSLSVQLNCLSMPILVKIIHDNEKVFLTGGFELSFLQKASHKEIAGSKENDLTDKFSSMDIAALFGLGFNIAIKKAVLTLELRYSQGLINVSQFESRDPEKYLPPEFKTKGLQFLAGVLYLIGK